MRNHFGISQEIIKIKIYAQSLWMDFGRRGGELEIKNQGRFGKRSRFTQGTEAIGQQSPRIGAHRLKLRFTHRVASAGSTWSSDSTPLFLSRTASVQNTLADLLREAELTAKLIHRNSCENSEL